jgi:regulator of sirC expression with transglutaminase-like and TPR domain
VSAASNPFDTLVAMPDDRIRLAAAALWFAADEYPDLKVAYYLRFLDCLAERVRAQKPSSPRERLEALRAEIVENQGFSGNREDYHNPENSYLNRVIQRRTGIPVSLAVLWLDLADRLGWNFAGLNMPGHFLICAVGNERDEDIIVDPFNGGAVLTPPECEHLAAAMFGPAFKLRPEHLARVGPKDILFRMLGNLRGIYLLRHDWIRCSRVLRRMLAVRPADPQVAAELAQMFATLGDFDKAVTVMHAALSLDHTGEQAAFLRRQLGILHRRIAQAN